MGTPASSRRCSVQRPAVEDKILSGRLHHGRRARAPRLGLGPARAQERHPERVRSFVRALHLHDVAVSSRSSRPMPVSIGA